MLGRLPIYEIEPALVAGLRESRRLTVSAPTGSGKSTQVVAPDAYQSAAAPLKMLGIQRPAAC